MKQLLLSFSLLIGICSINAQVTKPVIKPVTKPVAKPPLVLKTQADSISYVLGEFAAFKLVEQGMGEIRAKNGNAFLGGMNDVLDKKKTLVDDVAANALLNNYYMKMQEESAKGNIDAGKKFLAQNKLNPNVKTTASGLQYEVIKEGTGIKPTIVDTFVAHYRGTLLDGTEFDASYNRGEPLVYPLNKVVTGWTEGLQLMTVGSKYKFWIPYNLGYGTITNGKIPGGSTLVFELELLDVKKKATQ